MTLDWKEYERIARDAVGEGIVLLKNDNSVLPLDEGCTLAVFGRMQNNYYKSGTGSGGMVNVPRVYSIIDGLKEEKVTLNEKLLKLYEEFDQTHPLDPGVGFGQEPWSQEEMEVSDELVAQAAEESEIGLVIIGRTAGEEKDYVNESGAYKLAEKEESLLRKVRKAFDKMILVMNVSAVLDMQQIDEISPDSILYAWQGGEIGGLGCADVLMGRKNPSGRLADTIVRRIEDAPAYDNFGDPDRNFYAEDIYVGYRYYETFNKEAVEYPFGFGLSYTEFDIRPEGLKAGSEGGKKTIRISAAVKNTGSVPGKEVVQFYVSAPQGKLGKPVLSLVGFLKTEELEPGRECSLTISVDEYTFASYDETGVTGFSASYVLEEGEYVFYTGKNVRDLKEAGRYVQEKTAVVEKLSHQMVPPAGFKRIKPSWSETEGRFVISKEDTPFAELTDLEEAMQDRPEAKPYTGDRGIKLKDVRDGKADMDDFLAQLSDDDLSAIIRGEGMGSPKVTPGTAAAFGGVSDSLKGFGIPAGCCSDGPSGMRLDSGARAFSLPNGTLMACTWNTDLNTELYGMLGLEMNKNNVDFLLGPGMNIHRHPLNGRNFEYFSEDPLVTGKMAAAQIRGLKKGGVSGTLKHFCGNNQETMRHSEENVISERALREIYLKGFEIAIKEAGADAVMTTYGPVNGIWTNSRHDLNTNILRKEWGFKGVVMTDWWSNIGDVGKVVNKTAFSRLVLAQNDFYAVCPDAGINSSGDDTLEALSQGRITRGQLVRMAGNICGVLMNTNAMKRLCKEPYKVTVVNYSDDAPGSDPEDVEYFKIEDGTVIDMSDTDTKKGAVFFIGVDVDQRGCYLMDMVGKSDLSELSQIPVGIYFQGIAGGTFTFHGGGEEMTIRRKILFSSRYGVIRLKFMNGGLDLKEVRFTFEKELDPEVDWWSLDEYIRG